MQSFIPWRNSSDGTDRFHRLVPGSVSIRFGELTNTSRPDNELIQRQFKRSRVLIIFQVASTNILGELFSSLNTLWCRLCAFSFLSFLVPELRKKKIACLVSGRGAPPPSALFVPQLFLCWLGTNLAFMLLVRVRAFSPTLANSPHVQQACLFQKKYHYTTTYVYKSNYSSLCEYRVCHFLLVSSQIVKKTNIDRCAYDQKLSSFLFKKTNLLMVARPDNIYTLCTQHPEYGPLLPDLKKPSMSLSVLFEILQLYADIFSWIRILMVFSFECSSVQAPAWGSGWDFRFILSSAFLERKQRCFFFFF